MNKKACILQNQKALLPWEGPKWTLAQHLVAFLHFIVTYLGWHLPSSQYQRGGVKRMTGVRPPRVAEWGKVTCTPTLSRIRIWGNLFLCLLCVGISCRHYHTWLEHILIGALRGSHQGRVFVLPLSRWGKCVLFQETTGIRAQQGESMCIVLLTSRPLGIAQCEVFLPFCRFLF